MRRYGSDSLAYFTLHPRKSYFFSSDGEAMVAYAYAGGYALVSADPIGAPGSIALVLDEFLAYCRDRAWRVSFLAVREDNMPLYKERGLRGVYLGDEAMIDCRRFKLGGGAMKPVREAVNRVGREHRFSLIRETEAAPALIARLNEISRDWREGAEERGFTMELTRDVEGDRARLPARALPRREGSGRSASCGSCPATATIPGYSLDLMRRLPGAPNGLTEFLIANSALALGERGFRRLSMNFAAWGRLFEEDRNLKPLERVQKTVASALNPFFQIESLRDFNQKFQPDWLPRSIVIEDAAQMPRVGLLFGSIEGFVKLPLVGRLLRAAAAGRGVRAGRDAGIEQPDRMGVELELTASIGSLYQRAIVDTGKEPEFLFFVAFLVSFGFIRTSAHMIRAAGQLVAGQRRGRRHPHPPPGLGHPAAADLRLRRGRLPARLAGRRAGRDRLRDRHRADARRVRALAHAARRLLGAGGPALDRRGDRRRRDLAA